ncbi:MAG: hypothetical protein WDZ77_01070 [Candidatus Pacearchaeota archaeon]
MSELSPGEFLERMANDSQRHLGNSPYDVNCGECKIKIDSGRNLVRMFGVNYDPSCFLKVYAAERVKLKASEITYFDLIRDNLFAQRQEQQELKFD